MTACVLFDLDETVLDRTNSLVSFVNWQVDGMLRGQVEDRDAFVQRFLVLDDAGKVWKDQVYTQLIKEFSIEHWSVDDLLQSYLLSFCAFCVPRPGIKSALEYLKKRGIAMAIVTNGKSPFQERNTRSLSEYVFFDSIFVSESIGIRKPDKAIFHLACDSLQAEVSSSVFVGDNPIADVEGAKQAGMKTIYVPTDNSVNSCIHADAVVTNLFDLPAELDKLLP